jgi:ribonuclease-3
LLAVLGYRFADPGLLERALAHRSWCAENGDAPSNERLEFLGDAVLGLVVADHVYHHFADLPEGQLTNLRKAVVNADALADIARSIGLGQHVKLGRGEAAAHGHDKPSILSDALEAVIGAVYLDGGEAAATTFVSSLITDRLDAAADKLDHLDHKSRLQELVVGAGRGMPAYVVRSEGPDHAQRFYASVIVDGQVLGDGVGTSKKSAERAAAAAACADLDAVESPTV